jgi:hypothetical protein
MSGRASSSSRTPVRDDLMIVQQEDADLPADLWLLAHLRLALLR